MAFKVLTLSGLSYFFDHLKTIFPSIESVVPISRTVNGHQLNEDIQITLDELGGGKSFIHRQSNQYA